MADTTVAHMRVPNTVATSHPHFAALLSALSARLTADGANTATAKALEECRHCMQQARRTYLQWQTLATELHNIQTEHRAESASLAVLGAPTNSVIKDAAVRKLEHIEGGQYLQPLTQGEESGAACHLFGLDPTTCLVERHTTAEEREVLGLYLCTEIDGRLQERCRQLRAFYVPPAIDVDDGDVVTDWPTLSDEVEAEHRHMAHMRQEVSQKQDSVFEAKIQMAEVLGAMSRVLCTLVEDHLIGSQPHVDAVTSDWLLAHASAVRLKLSKVRHQLLVDTYTERTVPALARIRQLLDGEVEATRQQKADLERTVRNYQAVGLGFSEVVNEYHAVVEAIEEKSWQLQTLRESAGYK